MFRVSDDTVLTFQQNLIISNTSVGTAKLKLVSEFINNDISTGGSYTTYDRRSKEDGESVRLSIYLEDLKEQTV